jgi:hypothetical protein
VSSYFETITQNYERLDDPAWEKRFTTGNPAAEVPWMLDLIAR